MKPFDLRSIVILAIACLHASSPLGAETRIWMDRSGKFRLEAEYIGADGNNVQLKKADGTVITVALFQLSDADQRHVAELLKRAAGSPADTSANSQAGKQPVCWPDRREAEASPPRFEIAPLDLTSLGIPELASFGAKLHDVAGAPDGSMWFASNSGLSQLKDGKPALFHPFGDSKAIIERLLVTADGTLWAVSSKQGLARLQNGQWESFPLPETVTADPMHSINQLSAATAAPNGVIWLNSRLPGLLRFENGQWERRLAVEARRDFLGSINIQADAAGTIWSVIGGRGLLRYDGKRHDFVPNTPTSQPGAMTRSPDGKLLISFQPSIDPRSKQASGGGLWVIDGGPPQLFDKDNSPLPDNNISALAYAPDGALWVGLERNGVARLQGDQCLHFRDELNQRGQNTIRRMSVTPDGSVWIWGKTLYRVRPLKSTAP